MIVNKESNVLSLALWAEKPPIHNITSILYLEKSNSIITGSECGHMVIWNAKFSDNTLVPVNYIISHQSKVISLSLAGSRKYTDNDYFVSFAKFGEIGLWEAGNARSIAFRSNLSLDIQSIYSFESENLKQRVLLCCLKSPEIIVINSMSLTEICTLVCTTSLNMFSVVTAFNNSNKDDIVLASTESGIMSMWIMNFSDIINQPLSDQKHNASKSIRIDLSNSVTIAHNTHNTDIILVISACKFVIYYAMEWSILCYQNSHRGDYFISGEFISINSVLIHCKSGKSLYYKLPPRSDFGDPSFGQASSYLCDNIPHLLLKFKQPKNVTMMRHKVTTKVLEHGFVIWKGFIDGTICKWDFSESGLKITPQIHSLTNTWKNMIKKPSNLTNMIEDPSISGTVTSIIYLADMSLFVLGMHNGSIFITSFESSIGSVFRKCPQSKSESIKLVGHCGPVLCLMHPCSTMNLPGCIVSCNNPKVKACLHLLKLSHILWSGGEDFTLRVWNIKTQQCITVFNCHSSPIISLRLNHLPENTMNICGFSQGFTAAMFNSVSDGDAHSGEIRQLINKSMNSFIIAISEDDGISIFSIMRKKLLLYSISHDSPVKRVGWLLESGYVLLETITDTVYVWDLSSRSMDRMESGEEARQLMEANAVTTRVRSNSTRNIRSDLYNICRHSLSMETFCQCCEYGIMSDKILKFQFIKTGCSDRFVPVLILHLSNLLDSLEDSQHTPNDFYSLLTEMDNPVLRGFRNSDVISSFDSLMMDVTTINRDMDIKTSILKIILSLSNLQHTTSPLDSAIFKFLEMKSDTIACSYGKINSKTGSVIFDLRALFIEPDESSISIDQIMLQMSICNRIVNSSNRNRLESSIGTNTNMEADSNLLWSRKFSITHASLNLSEYYSATKFSKLLTIFQKSILTKNLPVLLQKTRKYNRTSDFNNHLSFTMLERIFDRLIIGLLDGCDWINTSAHEILVQVVSELSYQDLQHYLLATRSILLPDLNHYTAECGHQFSIRIQSYLENFSKQSFLISDWIWWYSSANKNLDNQKDKITKLQIKALMYLALIGTYLQSDDSIKSVDNPKPFSKVFSLDNFFLGRITCNFLMDILMVDPETVKGTKNRLLSLALMCLSVGFKVWEQFLNGTTLICQLFKLSDEDDEDKEENRFLVSSLAKQSLRCIAFTKPLEFIIVCHREMLRIHSSTMEHSGLDTTHSLMSSMKSSHKIKSTNDLRSSYDLESYKRPGCPSLFKKNILFPILDELCEAQPELIKEVLPEIVELYINEHTRYTHHSTDLHDLLYPVLRYTSVSIHALSGHISVGSSNGSLVLFDCKIGKYFTHMAHIKSITYTLFSNDAKHLATYSVEDCIMKIWQISHTGLLHLGSGMYHVRMILSEVVPSIDDMILATITSATDNIDSSVKSKKKRHKKPHKAGKKLDRPSSVICNETGVGLNWDVDNKAVSIHFNGRILRSFKL